jgi:mannobiose 2-epimerase
MSRDGTPLTEGYEGTPPKDYNSLIHLLESLSELYRAWPDSLVHERLSSLLRIIRDTVTTRDGYMLLYFNRDWTHVSYRDSSTAVREEYSDYDHVSFGHDVETAYLMLEASEALGIKNDTTTLKIGKKLVDHTLRNGWDDEHGGIFDGGYYVRGEGKISILYSVELLQELSYRSRAWRMVLGRHRQQTRRAVLTERDDLERKLPHVQGFDKLHQQT